MKRKRNLYNIFQKSSAIFMMMALLWLTVSSPFMFADQQESAKHNKAANAASPFAQTEEESANPFGSASEEKAPTTTSFSEEYLHDHHITDHFFSIALQYHKCENADIYIAYHGELLVPPPNVA